MSNWVACPKCGGRTWAKTRAITAHGISRHRECRTCTHKFRTLAPAADAPEVIFVGRLTLPQPDYPPAVRDL